MAGPLAASSAPHVVEAAVFGRAAAPVPVEPGEEVVLAPHHPLGHPGGAAGVEHVEVVGPASLRRHHPLVPGRAVGTGGLRRLLVGDRPRRARGAVPSSTHSQLRTPGTRWRTPSMRLDEGTVEDHGHRVGVLPQVHEPVVGVAVVGVDGHEAGLVPRRSTSRGSRGSCRGRAPPCPGGWRPHRAATGPRCRPAGRTRPRCGCADPWTSAGASASASATVSQTSAKFQLLTSVSSLPRASRRAAPVSGGPCTPVVGIARRPVPLPTARPGDRSSLRLPAWTPRPPPTTTHGGPSYGPGSPTIRTRRAASLPSGDWWRRTGPPRGAWAPIRPTSCWWTRSCGGPACAVRTTPSGSAGPDRPSCTPARPSRRTGTSSRCSPPTRSGASSSVSPAPARPGVAHTRAELDGDEWVVRARRCGPATPTGPTYGILLARTDPDAPITRASPTSSARWTPRGHRASAGRHDRGPPFNEVFLDEVRLPAANLVGERGRGLALAKVPGQRAGVTVRFRRAVGHGPHRRRPGGGRPGRRAASTTRCCASGWPRYGPRARSCGSCVCDGVGGGGRARAGPRGQRAQGTGRRARPSRSWSGEDLAGASGHADGSGPVPERGTPADGPTPCGPSGSSSPRR